MRFPAYSHTKAKPASSARPVSILETVAAIQDAQRNIRYVTGILADNDSHTDADVERAALAIHFAAMFLADTMPSVELVMTNRPPTTFDVMRMIYAQLIHGLSYKGTYRNCLNPECRKLFTPKEMGRPADALYHSPECQTRAKYLRYRERQGRRQKEEQKTRRSAKS